MASVAVPSAFALPQASRTTRAPLVPAAGPQAAGLNAYTYAPNGNGGVNYFLNGRPITNQMYGIATGSNTNAIEAAARGTGGGGNTTPAAVQPLSGGVGSGPAAPTAAQLNPLFSSLDQLGGILANKNAQSQAEFDRAIAGYNEADALDLQNRNKSIVNNEQSLTSGNQAALLNAANGATGLRGVLSSLGALGGSGLNVIKRLVGRAANTDTGNVRQNFDANAGTINSAFSETERQSRQRRADADATLQNSKQNNESTILTSRQSIYQQLANAYGAGSAEGTRYASEAGALAAPIAATTRATVAPYATASSLYTPAALQTYLAGTQNLNAAAATDAVPINSPVYTTTRQKDKLPGVA